VYDFRTYSLRIYVYIVSLFGSDVFVTAER